MYEINYLSDKSDPTSMKQQWAELLLGEEKSLFRSMKKAQSDSAYMAYVKNKVINMSAPSVKPIGEINSFNYQIIKDYSSGMVKVYDEYSGGSLNQINAISFYEEASDGMSNWVLKNDTMRIHGYVCQRADIEFAGRKWTAWFSSEAPLKSDGPYKFNGLPGLIFKVYDEEKSWDFELKSLSKKDTSIAINFKEGLTFSKIKKEKLFQDRRKFQKNIIEINETNGANHGDSRNQIKSSLESHILKDNNWIEEK
ncbi:GLPGLI family protein [Sphingobacterium sp. HJSM2_6]|uniref:GLPGLI family protein n=1 Tax=Sphingobacterium sp. HJSM2_6 TaxID=3366264 RepID=UPI003BD1C982